MLLETPFPVKKQANCTYTRNRISDVIVFPNRILGSRVYLNPHSSEMKDCILMILMSKEIRDSSAKNALE